MSKKEIEPIAVIHTPISSKFGIPRQSGLAASPGRIVFEKAYRSPEAVRGLEEYSHLWLIWEFTEAKSEGWSPTVRPPRLGGNVRMGVFATRSPFRPNALGLSCVRLASVEERAGLGTVLVVRGADLMDGTPIFDVKPYVPYADAHPGASGGFAPAPEPLLEVRFAAGEEEKLPPDKRAALRGVLANDPRPRYQADPERVYALRFAGREIRFRAEAGALTVLSVEEER